MTENDLQTQTKNTTIYDMLLAFLTSLLIGGGAWAALLGLIALTRFGAGYFDLIFPDNYFLDLVLLNLPWLSGVIVGLINYGKVLELEG